MDCPYLKNEFFPLLSPQIRKTLCESCTKIRYPSGSVFVRDNWKDVLAMLVDGFVITAKPDLDEEHFFTPMELGGSGHLLSVPQSWTSIRWKDTSSFVILDSVIAVFDQACVQKLYDYNIDFVKSVCETCLIGYHEMALALQEIGGKNAQSAVRYVLQFCKKYNVPHLTHAQIALAAGLTRPTVTKVLHGLLKTEPELFQPRKPE